MTRSWQIFLVAAVAVAAAGAGYGVNLWRMSGAPPEDDAARAVMAARLVDLDGEMRPIGQWRGKVLVVNFWATWCAPCREEIPGFVRLQEKYRDEGLQFVGIAIDRPDPVRAFAREFGMNYPVLMGGIEAVDMSRRAGNRVGALPYTVVLDRAGRIVATELGGIKEAKLESIIRPLL
jgi:thiol-disulfide isomerase/thioredoxin